MQALGLTGAMRKDDVDLEGQMAQMIEQDKSAIQVSTIVHDQDWDFYLSFYHDSLRVVAYHRQGQQCARYLWQDRD